MPSWKINCLKSDANGRPLTTPNGQNLTNEENLVPPERKEI
ncbi:unnamed protein product, partial [Didymodactylos carnosus]